MNNLLIVKQCPDRSFYDLLDAILPTENGVLVVLQAHFDASKRPDGTFCVAGYAFAKPQVKKFNKAWWDLFGEYGGCHMKELAHRVGRFKDISKDASDRLIKEAVKIIRKRFAFGVGVSCELAEIHALLPTWINGFQHAYPVCCHIAMTSLGRIVADSGHDEEIAYIFESGDLHSGTAHNFMSMADISPELKLSYRHFSHTFMDKVDALPLQAADILAWEYAKYMDETRGKRIRKMRMSLASLIREGNDYDIKHYRLNHLTGVPLQRYCRQVAALGLMQLADDKAVKTKRSASD